MKAGADGAEEYVSVRADGTNEHALFSTSNCACLAWSPDRSAIWAVSTTSNGMARFMTMQPDGSQSQVHEPPIATLNLVVGAGTADGSLIAFNGWDETDSDRDGIWVSGPALADLRLVTPLPPGAVSIATAALGVTPDGGRIVFFSESGREGDVTHAGDLYVVDSDGDNLRQLNDANLHLSMVQGLPATLSPDGQRAAFAAFEGDPAAGRSAVYVVRLDGGPAQRVTDFAPGIWSAAWAPVGESITFATWAGDTAVVSIVRSDGSERRDLSGHNESVGFGAWSPDGNYLLVARGADHAQRDLWIIDLEGNYIGQVTDDPGDYVMYAWGRGGDS